MTSSRLKLKPLAIARASSGIAAKFTTRMVGNRHCLRAVAISRQVSRKPTAPNNPASALQVNT
jgi:hypothetical protein